MSKRITEDGGDTNMRVRKDRIARAHGAAILTAALCGNEESNGQRVRTEFNFMLAHVDKFVDGDE